MSLFQALYGRRYRSPIDWFEVGELTLIATKLVHETTEKVRLIREIFKTTQVREKLILMLEKDSLNSMLMTKVT